MDANEQRKRRRGCDIGECTHLALIFSEPPRCGAHIEDIDAWFDNVLSETVARNTSKTGETTADLQHYSDALVAHEIYRGLLLNKPPGQDLYADLKGRVDPLNKVSFSFDDVVYFALIAAGSGIIGNFAYDVLKSIVKTLSKNHSFPELEETFEEAVRESKYEELRIQYHADVPCNTEATSELKTEVETRYRLVMFKEMRRRRTKRRARSK
jgi:hypothetical protein